MDKEKYVNEMYEELKENSFPTTEEREDYLRLEPHPFTEFVDFKIDISKFAPSHRFTRHLTKYPHHGLIGINVVAWERNSQASYEKDFKTESILGVVIDLDFKDKLRFENVDPSKSILDEILNSEFFSSKIFKDDFKVKGRSVISPSSEEKTFTVETLETMFTSGFVKYTPISHITAKALGYDFMNSNEKTGKLDKYLNVNNLGRSYVSYIYDFLDKPAHELKEMGINIKGKNLREIGEELNRYVELNTKEVNQSKFLVGTNMYR